MEMKKFNSLCFAFSMGLQKAAEKTKASPDDFLKRYTRKFARKVIFECGKSQADIDERCHFLFSIWGNAGLSAEDFARTVKRGRVA